MTPGQLWMTVRDNSWLKGGHILQQEVQNNADIPLCMQYEFILIEWKVPKEVSFISSQYMSED